MSKLARATLILAGGLALSSPSEVGRAQQEAPASATAWRLDLYNPKPSEDDLILPMPCGGAMVFRPVEVPSGGWLDDRQIELGRTDENLAYKEGRLLTHIAGAFTDPENPSRRFYYMAKYETSQLQYEAFGEGCPQPRRRKRLPVVSVSWFDAVTFARKYSEWLLTNTRERLPFEGETPGYVRLPTEVEWEYAARRIAVWGGRMNLLKAGGAALG